MYAVSDAYKVAIADSHRKSKMRAVLTTESAVINLDDNDIIKDTVYISNQCTNGSEYEYGCVYSAECGLTIKSDVNRYDLYDAELRLFWSLWTGAEWEEIPLGVFYVSEPNRINDKISIKAVDGMTKLDVDVDEDTQGTLVQLLPYLAEKCGVELSQTTEELSAFVNADIQWSVYADKVETYRDLVAYMCMMSACFATFDREGKLTIVPYATEVGLVLDKKQRFQNATFSDYSTKFKGIKARFIAEENYAPYVVKEDTTGLFLDMGDIPIVRGLPENKTLWLTNVFDVLKGVKYTPCEFETLGNPAIDLGDLIVNKNVGKDQKSYKSPVTAFTWNYRGKQKIKAVGGNPKLSGIKSREDRQMDSLEGDIQARDITVKSYVNADAISFKSTEADIATFNYAATESSRIMFLMTLRVSLDCDGVICLKFYTDSVEDTERCFRKYLDRGEHFLALTELYNAETNDRHTIVVRGAMEYFESDSRQQAAALQTCNNFLDAIKTTGATVTDNVVVFPSYAVGTIDTTVPTASVAKGGVKAILYGQGLAGEGKWDGTINMNEKLGRVPFSSAIQSLFEEVSMDAHTQNPTKRGFSALFGHVPFSSSLSFVELTESITSGKVIKDYTFNASKADAYMFDKYVTTTNDMFALKTSYEFGSTEELIDEGKMSSVTFDYTGLDVESVVVKNG